MRLAVLSDIHGNLEKLAEGGKILRDADAIIVCGDISRHGDLKEIKEVISELKEINPAIFAIPGNMDGKDSINILEELGVNIHGKQIEVKGIKFAGCGGSTKTPFGTPFELDEDFIYNCLKNNLNEPEKTVVVCHNPPYKTKTDRTIFGMHVGSKKLRNLIEDKQPVAFLCGHIHESANIDFLGKTLILNPGPFRRGGIGIVEIDEENVSGRIERV
ncbi:conserved hypothetical protein [Thermotomaculum hydrothermale]|uniref:Calcineurin-like phosphoesterase domain-containing protein n=1 Tax=Thermotomaculum hydrothermale TaxID=981385 RepID=A0A7R6SZE3_9BACT|nr:metallophosphoesterase [Thermotomaculum hydrothermale]BBB32760.1 conserved hypothetical protein [Thermotomaculum hydrothermale]